MTDGNLSFKNQNTQLTEKSVGITIQNSLITQLKNDNTQLTKNQYPIHQNFLSGALLSMLAFLS